MQPLGFWICFFESTITLETAEESADTVAYFSRQLFIEGSIWIEAADGRLVEVKQNTPGWVDHSSGLGLSSEIHRDRIHIIDAPGIGWTYLGNEVKKADVWFHFSLQLTDGKQGGCMRDYDLHLVVNPNGKWDFSFLE